MLVWLAEVTEITPRNRDGESPYWVRAPIIPGRLGPRQVTSSLRTLGRPDHGEFPEREGWSASEGRATASWAVRCTCTADMASRRFASVLGPRSSIQSRRLPCSISLVVRKHPLQEATWMCVSSSALPSMLGQWAPNKLETHLPSTPPRAQRGSPSLPARACYQICHDMPR